MKKIFSILTIALQSALLPAQFSSPQWERAIGGSQYDFTKDVERTFDGGFITIGYTESSDGTVSSNHGGGDCWIVKFDAAGAIEWERTYGGTGYDYGYSIIQTADGGYAATGYSESTDGDLISNHGGGDCWVIKLDNAGDIEWQKVFGGSLNDDGQCISQSMDGGYIIAGNTESADGDVTASYGGGDCWIIKLNYTGTVQWQKVMGGTNYDYVQHISLVAGGGYIFCGGTHSGDLDVSAQKGNGDCWVVMLNNSGATVWQNSFGGSEYDFAQSVEQTTDGGFVVAGYSDSNDGDITGSSGGGDCWVFKVDASGLLVWQNALGSTGNDYAYSICENSDGSFAMTGYSELNDGDVTGNHGAYDCWLVMVSSAGDATYQRSLGGSALDAGYSVCQLSSGSFVVAGYTQSDDGDITTNHGTGDGWILKVNATTTGVDEEDHALQVVIAPNPSNGIFYFSGLNPGCNVEVYNAEGKIIRAFESMNEIEKLDLENEARGIYFFRIILDGKTETGKIILN